MAEKEIVWTVRATNELIDVLGFYIERNRSSSYSEKLLAAIEKRIQLIAKYPQIGKKAESGEVRVFIYKKFGIIYRIKSQKLYILSIRDFRQSPEKQSL